MAAVRIAGVNLPGDKRAEIGLTYIFGLGLASSRQILKAAQIDPNRRIRDLSEAEISQIREQLERYQVEGDLSRLVSTNIKRLKDINAYRGLRHKANLPVRGQRTKTNARTKRGKKITMGSGRKKTAAKT